MELCRRLSRIADQLTEIAERVRSAVITES
jgi:uncharacterized protein Yka (UPF0111/DUF47 family)